MRLENCIRRWLGLKNHKVRSLREEGGRLIAEIEAVGKRLPRCGCCGGKVRRTEGKMRRRLWRAMMVRHLPLVLAYTCRRVVCPRCGVRVEKVSWADRWSRVTKSLACEVAELAPWTDPSTVAVTPKNSVRLIPLELTMTIVRRLETGFKRDSGLPVRCR